METLRGGNDRGMLIEILQHIPDDAGHLIHLQRARSCMILHVHKFLFAHILISFQSLLWVAKLI